MNDIGIVIVNYNVRHFLMQCLHSIRKAKNPELSIEIWVVDNASTDGAAEILATEFPEVNLIVNQENVGFSKANNQAIRALNSKYTLLLNPDTLIQEDTLIKCFQYMETHMDAGALGVRMIDGKGNFLPESKRKIPDLWNSFCKLTFLSKVFPTSRWFSGYNLGYLPEHENSEIEVLCGAFMFMRSDVLSKTGLLDEQFFMYGEDIDLSFRILKAGYKIIYFPETSIIHFKGESTQKNSLKYVKTFYGAMILYVKKHYPGTKSWIFTQIILMLIQLRALASMFARIGHPWVKMIADGVLICFVLNYFVKFWAAWYFQNNQYYANAAINTNVILYTVFWVTSLWFFGLYDQSTTYKRIWYGTILGTLGILLIYALETNEFRTSRMLIIAGSIFVLFYGSFRFMLAMKFRQWTGKIISEIERNTAIVGKEKEAIQLKSNFLKSGRKESQVILISPEATYHRNLFVDHIENLDQIIRQYAIQEVVFCTETLTIKEIIQLMSRTNPGVSIKLTGDRNLSLIGGNISASESDLVSIQVNYILNDPLYKRLKFTADILCSTLFLSIFPIIWIINGGKMSVFRHILEVLAGKKTWIGYGGEASDYIFLPKIPKGIVSYPMARKFQRIEKGHFKHMNIRYATQYSLWDDLELIAINITNLS